MKVYHTLRRRRNTVLEVGDAVKNYGDDLLLGVVLGDADWLSQILLWSISYKTFFEVTYVPKLTNFCHSKPFLTSSNS
jgi:hypothetical protein